MREESEEGCDEDDQREAGSGIWELEGECSWDEGGAEASVRSSD